MLDIDFEKQAIITRDYTFRIYYASVAMLKGQIRYALRNWHDATAVDESKGQYIYCYVGPNSNLESIQNIARDIISSTLEELGCDKDPGAPVAVHFCMMQMAASEKNCGILGIAGTDE